MFQDPVVSQPIAVSRPVSVVKTEYPFTSPTRPSLPPSTAWPSARPSQTTASHSTSSKAAFPNVCSKRRTLCPKILTLMSTRVFVNRDLVSCCPASTRHSPNVVLMLGQRLGGQRSLVIHSCRLNASGLIVTEEIV